MINSIIAAISVALDTEFGYESQMEEIIQDLTPPCFFIQCLNPTTDLFLGKRYFRQNMFCIQYFPQESKYQQKECNEVAERMLWCLEYITANGDRMRGTKMHYDTTDDGKGRLVLNFFLNYDCFVYKVENDEVMITLESSTNLKEGDGVGS